MNEDRFDVIIVGGGMAGLVAAYELAMDGQEVMLVERGDYCGAKNMTGGRLYGHSLEKIFPGFGDEAPIERKITKETVSLMSARGALNIQYSNPSLGDIECASYTVERAKIDAWLAEKCEEAGVMLVTGIRVDECLVEDGKVVGIDAGGEAIYGNCVILADGVNSLLAQKLGMKKELLPGQVAVGAKEVIKLSEEIINERFNVKSGEGAAMLIAGDPTDGNLGGGFIYTNKDSLAVGIVTTLSDIGRSEVTVPQMVERLKAHPAVAPLIEGGELAEYSAHLVSEGGYNMIPELYRDGVLVVGDAAALVVNLGYSVRGMDFAVESGHLAAKALIKAKATDDYSAKSLSYYKALLDNSFVIKDMKKYRNFPELLESHEIFNDIPEICDNVAGKLFKVDGKTPVNLPMYIFENIAQHTTAQKLMDFAMKALNAL